MPKPHNRPIELKTTPVEGQPPPFRPPLSPPPAWLPLGVDDDEVYRDLIDAGMPTVGIISERTLYQAVCRFQLRMGIIVDGEVGPQTKAAFAGAETLRPKPTYWDGKPKTPRSMGANMPWFVADGLIITTENVSPSKAEMDAAKLVRVNFRQELELVEPGWRHMFLSVLLTESGGRKKVDPRYEPHLDDYSLGPCQILFGTAKSLGYAGDPEGLNDPMTNAEFCMRLMQRNRRRKLRGLVDPILEVAAYNAGGIYPSGRNAWGIRHYGKHLSRFVKNWNALTLSGSGPDA